MNTDQLYNIFITNVLPKVSDGIQLTKDYVFELYGRYIKYLITMDIAGVVIGIILIFISYYLLKKNIKRYNHPIFVPLAALSLSSFIIGLCMSISNSLHLIEDIYIPEIRIYNILQTK